MKNRIPRKKVALLCIVAVTVLLTTLPLQAESQASDRYVDVNIGSDSANDCLNPSAPCRTIQRAVNQAESGDTIHVASGTYTYPGSDNPCEQYLNGARSVVCIINKQLAINGGYPSGDWANPDSDAYLTVIDGENRVRGVYVISPEPQNPSRAGIHMEGFTIRQGFFQGASSGNDERTFAFGGGMLTDYASVVLRNMRFENNTVIGGGAQNEYGGSASGGGVAIRRTPQRATLENLVFVSNRAEGGSGRTRGGYSLGGGLYTLMTEMDASALEFYDNVSQAGHTQGNGRTSDYQMGDAFGAGVTVMGYADVNLYNIIARGNRSIGGNAGVNAGGAFGGAIKAEGMPNLDIDGDGRSEVATMRVFGCDLTDNYAIGGNGTNGGMSAGGALETIHTTVLIDRCNVQNNVSQGGDGSAAQGPAGGGGLYLQNIFYSDSSAVVKNSVIAGNQVAAGAGSAVGGGGGGIWLQGIEATIMHNTIVGNRMLTSPLQGSAILVMSDGVVNGPRPANIRYNIISDHTDSGVSALHVKPSNTAYLAYNLFYANSSNLNTSQTGDINGMETSVLGNPRFIDGSVTGNAWGFQISASSAAVDRAVGSNEISDIENKSRSGVPDIGAFESAPFQVWILQVSSETLRAYWGDQNDVDHYLLTVSCPQGANPPNELSCNVPTRYPGSADSVLLTGLTNYANYNILVSALDSSGSVLMTNEGTAMPTDIFVFVPVIAK